MPLREEQKALTRARIVDAAKSVFEEHGYGAASIGTITDVAGINRATFYLHFPDKFAVFREVVAHDRLHTDEYWRELNSPWRSRSARPRRSPRGSSGSRSGPRTTPA
jgi:AcrR family transcriptional regulator